LCHSLRCGQGLVPSGSDKLWPSIQITSGQVPQQCLYWSGRRSPTWEFSCTVFASGTLALTSAASSWQSRICVRSRPMSLLRGGVGSDRPRLQEVDQTLGKDCNRRESWSCPQRKFTISLAAIVASPAQFASPSSSKVTRSDGCQAAIIASISPAWIYGFCNRLNARCAKAR